jgi:hypothetical protein
MIRNGNWGRRKAPVYKPQVSPMEFMCQWMGMIDRLDPNWRQQIDVDGINIAIKDLLKGDDLLALDGRKLDHLQEFVSDLQGNMILVLTETAAKNPEFAQAGNVMGWLLLKERGSSLENDLLRRARCDAMARFIVIMVDAFEHRLSQIRLAAEERENRELRRPHVEFPSMTEDTDGASPDEVLIAKEAARNVFTQLRDDWNDQIFGAIKEFLSDPASFTVREIAVRHGVSSAAVSRAVGHLRRIAKPYLESCSRRVLRVYAESLVAAFKAA